MQFHYFGQADHPCVSHAQSETHPEHLGLLAFKEYVEERLGDKYEVQIFPNEILGSAQKAIELTQTGAIDFVVAGTANLETFAGVVMVYGGISITKLTMIQTTASLRVPMGYIYVIVPITGVMIMLFSLMNAADMLHTDFSKKEEAGE